MNNDLCNSWKLVLESEQSKPKAERAGQIHHQSEFSGSEVKTVGT